MTIICDLARRLLSNAGPRTSLKKHVPLIQSQSSEELDCSGDGLSGDSPFKRERKWDTKISLAQTPLENWDQS